MIFVEAVCMVYEVRTWGRDESVCLYGEKPRCHRPQRAR